MKCDDVFDVLTRGPFPSGDRSDEFVEDHLAGCHDCRQLAEALRPAIELFHESLESERCELPGYSGQHGETAAAITTAVMDQIRVADKPQPTPMSTTPRRHMQLWQLVVAGFVGLALSASLLAISQRDRETDDRTVATDTPSLTHYGRNHLSSMKLPIKCASFVDSGKEDRNYKCCTVCHAASSKRKTPMTAVVRLAAACKSCHSTKNYQ